jgi:hypothetical protein
VVEARAVLPLPSSPQVEVQAAQSSVPAAAHPVLQTSQVPAADVVAPVRRLVVPSIWLPHVVWEVQETPFK